MFEADKPRKTHECPLKITAWFRCISYWNSPWLFRGSAVSFRHGLSFAIIFHIFCVRIHQEFSFASGSHESQRAPSPPKNDVKWFRVSSKTTSRKVTVDQAISWSVNPHWSAKKHAVFLVPKSGSPVFRKRSFFFPHDLPRDFIQHPTSGCWPWGASGAPDPSEENKALWQWVISLRRGELGVGRGPGPWKVLNTWKTTLTYKCIWKRRSPTYFSPNVWDVGKKFALAKKTKIAHSPTGYVCSFRFFLTWIWISTPYWNGTYCIFWLEF